MYIFQVKEENRKHTNLEYLTFHCSIAMRGLSRVEKRHALKVGWCVTRRDVTGKIERWGYCSENCKDKKDTFTFANVNLLSDEECFKFDTANDTTYNPNYELCAGKKHLRPVSKISFERKKKKKKQFKKGMFKFSTFSIKFTLQTKNLPKTLTYQSTLSQQDTGTSQGNLYPPLKRVHSIGSLVEVILALVTQEDQFGEMLM